MRRTRLSLLVVILLAFLSGCADRPEYLVDKEEMASLLYDIHRMDALASSSYFEQPEEKPYCYKKILQEHNITPEQFDSCVAWYTRNSDEYLQVYDIVLKKLEAEKDSLSSNKTPAEL